MIRYFTPADEDAVIRIWLDASRLAHDFVEPGFWEKQEEQMRRQYLPASEVWVYDDDLTGEVVGFAALRDHFVAALFVDPARQGEGIGFQLIEKIKSKHRQIDLNVFKENEPSVAFYRRQGFTTVGEGVDPHTGHPEWHMRFRLV
jgi:putative acetyltransferase